ncbi:MAG TPA: hypothetical protein VMV00_02580 [Candidatus Baltobacteraceae bacterium]|nr:hypothetical protein [Candidatus Baltobacteraceae bacterium]
MAEDQDVEIELEDAQKLVASGKSHYVWVLGPINTDILKMKLDTESEIMVVHPQELLQSTNPKALVGETPIFVCEHGVTSFFLAEKLKPKGVNARSLAGGVDGIGR